MTFKIFRNTNKTRYFKYERNQLDEYYYLKWENAHAQNFYDHKKNHITLEQPKQINHFVFSSDVYGFCILFFDVKKIALLYINHFFPEPT